MLCNARFLKIVIICAIIYLYLSLLSLPREALLIVSLYHDTFLFIIQTAL